MSLLTDQSYLRHDQYNDSANLAARASLHRRFSTNPRGWSRWVFDQLPLHPGQRVLEVGGGPAWLWRENVDRLPPGLRLCFSDFSFGMVREARQALTPDERLACLNLDVQAIPLASGLFGVVIANHMLYHVPDLRRGVSEMARILEPGGRLFAATNGMAHLRALYDLVHEFEPAYARRDGNAISFRLENAAEILGWEFAPVEVRRYADALWVTEARPLADYVYSGWSRVGKLEAARVGELEAFFQAKIDAEGGIRIAKDAGLVTGIKRE